MVFGLLALALTGTDALAADVVDWSDDFSSYGTGGLSGSGGWITGYAADTWSVTGGYAYALTDDSGTGWGTGTATDNHLVYATTTWSDFTLDGTLFSNDDDVIGVVFRYTDASNFYLLVLGGGTSYPGTGAGAEGSTLAGSALYAVSGGLATAIATSTTSYTASLTHRFEIVASGTALTVYLDKDADGAYSASEDLFGTVTDTTLTSGNVGIYCYNDGSIGGCRFDDLVVSVPDTDGDTLADIHDNCPAVANLDQADLDVDGLGDACDPDADGDGSTSDVDCADLDATIHPGVDERCDGIDNNCDGSIDEPTAIDALTWYVDLDGDGFGDAGSPEPACSAPAGDVADASDCDDTSAAVSPGMSEACNGLDDDCDVSVDEQPATDAATWYADDDDDGIGGDNRLVSCAPPGGYVATTGDCDDEDPARTPGNDETCDGVDQDCDATVDEDALDAPTWYPDVDEDGYGDESAAVLKCSTPPGDTSIGGDCDDADASAHPGGTDLPDDGVDQDCDGQDAHGASSRTYSGEQVVVGTGCACDGSGGSGGGWMAVLGLFAVRRRRLMPL